MSDCEIECALLDTYSCDHSERGNGTDGERPAIRKASEPILSFLLADDCEVGDDKARLAGVGHRTRPSHSQCYDPEWSSKASIDWEQSCLPIVGRRIARSIDGVRSYEFSQPLSGDYYPNVARRDHARKRH